MNDDRTKILNRIHKMLSVAEGNANPHESAVAAAMAEKLMRKHNLAHADVLLAELNDDAIVATQSDINYRSNVPMWITGLVVPIARLHDCEVKFTQGTSARGQKTDYITYLGEAADTQVACWVLHYLVAEIRRLGKQFKAEHGATARDMETFRRGASIAVGQTLARMIRDKRTEVEAHSKGTALVVAKAAMIKRKFKVAYRTTQIRCQDNGAAAAGVQAGRGVRINPAVTGGGASPLLLT